MRHRAHLLTGSHSPLYHELPKGRGIPASYFRSDPETELVSSEGGSGERVPDTERGLCGPVLNVISRKWISDSALPEGSC